MDALLAPDRVTGTYSEKDMTFADHIAKMREELKQINETKDDSDFWKSAEEFYQNLDTSFEVIFSEAE